MAAGPEPDYTRTVLRRLGCVVLVFTVLLLGPIALVFLGYAAVPLDSP